MPDLSSAGQLVKTPPVFDYVGIGTAVGTTTIQTQPGFLHSVVVGVRVASGSVILYDSVGTSGTVIGTIQLGSQTFSDAPPSYIFDVRTKNGLTAVNSANLGAVVTFGR